MNPPRNLRPTHQRRLSDQGHNPPSPTKAQMIDPENNPMPYWHGTRRVIDKGALRRANRLSWRKINLAERSRFAAARRSIAAVDEALVAS